MRNYARNIRTTNERALTPGDRHRSCRSERPGEADVLDRRADCHGERPRRADPCLRHHVPYAVESQSADATTREKSAGRNVPHLPRRDIHRHRRASPHQQHHLLKAPQNALRFAGTRGVRKVQLRDLRPVEHACVRDGEGHHGGGAGTRAGGGDLERGVREGSVREAEAELVVRGDVLRVHVPVVDEKLFGVVYLAINVELVPFCEEM
jgi:hypothetical protein